jgi:hypothetical protein
MSDGVTDSLTTISALAMSDSALPPLVADTFVGDKHGRLPDVQAPCTFLVRGTRPCKNRARDDGSGLCSHHQPDRLAADRAFELERAAMAALAASRLSAAPAGGAVDLASDHDSDSDRDADEGATVAPTAATGSTRIRVSSSQKRMVNPFNRPTPCAVPQWVELFADVTLPVHVDIGCARGVSDSRFLFSFCLFVCLHIYLLFSVGDSEISAVGDVRPHASDEVDDNDHYAVCCNCGVVWVGISVNRCHAGQVGRSMSHMESCGH